MHIGYGTGIVYFKLVFVGVFEEVLELLLPFAELAVRVFQESGDSPRFHRGRFVLFPGFAHVCETSRGSLALPASLEAVDDLGFEIIQEAFVLGR